MVGILSDAARYLWRHRVPYGVAWIVTLFVSILLYPSDALWLARIQQMFAEHQKLAETLSEIGYFKSSSLAFAVVLTVAGLVGRADRLRRAAVACLLAGVIAGLCVLVLRPALGRARPDASLAPGFHWLESGDELRSMPSGHTMTNTASAVAIAVTLPPLAVPVLAYAVGVGWSRMQLNRHYPTDVLWGAVLGASTGLAIGVATRDRRRPVAS